MNHALGMRIRQPLRWCCFGGVSSSLLRNKTYGRGTLLCTQVLLEIKPELGKFLKSYLRTNKLEPRNPFQAKLPSCLQWYHIIDLCFIPIPDEFIALVLILLLFAMWSKQESKINLSTYTRLYILFFAIKKVVFWSRFSLLWETCLLLRVGSNICSHTHTRW